MRARYRLALGAGLLLALTAVILGCGEEGPAGADGASEAPGGALASSHVHSLSVDPQTGALMIATHDGLFELDEQLGRVGSQSDDLMGFDIAGPSSYVASGHPGKPGAGVPPHLGLIASDDGGESWKTISLEGQADFHALQAQGRRIYGYNGLSGELLRSDDRGRSWVSTDQVGDVVDLAIDRADPDRLLASTDQGLFITDDAGESWESFQGPPGLLAWTSTGIYVFDAYGKVLGGDETGLEAVGRLGKLPVAVTGTGDQLYLATDEGEIFRSPNGGENWEPVPAS